jgi:hypothetical protein
VPKPPIRCLWTKTRWERNKEDDTAGKSNFSIRSLKSDCEKGTVLGDSLSKGGTLGNLTGNRFIDVLSLGLRPSLRSIRAIVIISASDSSSYLRLTSNAA